MERKPREEQNALIQVSMSPDCREWWWSMPSGTRSEAIRKLIRKEIARKGKKGAKSMNEYESWLTSELAFRRQEILNRIRDMESTLDGLRHRVETDMFLNSMGEIQVSGGLLDTAIAAYATERQALKNLKEMQP